MDQAKGDTLAVPVSERERIGEVDVLRGIALLGVLLMNFVAFASDGVMATEAQLEALPFSHWWLARYRFGPMEWLWRWLTYGTRPQFRRQVAVAQIA